MRSKLILSVLVATIIGLLCFDAGQTLLLGWVGFLVRVLPRLNPDPPTVLVSIAAAAIFTIGIHWLGRAWARRRDPVGEWKLRWSAALTLLLFGLFTASVAMVGIVHMTIWYATDPHPLRDLSVIDKWAAPHKRHMSMKYVGLGFHNYESIESKLPAGGTFSPSGQPLHGWEMALVRSTAALSVSAPRLDSTVPWNHPANAAICRSQLGFFMNPSLPDPPEFDGDGFALNHYSGNSHVLRAGEGLRLDEITDGLTNTFLMGEVNNYFSPWGRPMNVRDPALGINRTPRGFGGAPYAGGAQMLMADGSVRFMRESVSPTVLRALSTPASGDTTEP